MNINNNYKDLAAFMDASPVNFWAIKTLAGHLSANGFKELDMRDAWELTDGGRYFVKKNDSALFAFVVGAAKLQKATKLYLPTAILRVLGLSPTVRYYVTAIS